MKITNEMIELATKSNQKCTIYGDNVLLYKSFDVTDNKIDDYINKISKLKTMEINTPAILDYVKVKNSSYGYSKSVILEEKAKGRNLDTRNIYLNFSEDVNFDQISSEYLHNLDDYLNEIEQRANAPQDYYDKFASDYLKIIDFGMMIDPKPLNFYFSSETGFTFIDINDSGKDDMSYLPRYIFGGVMGYGIPSLSIGADTCNYIDNERMKKVQESYQKIIEKVTIALMKLGYNKERIVESSLNWINQAQKLIIIDDMSKLSSVLFEQYNYLKEKEEKEKSAANDDWTIGW